MAFYAKDFMFDGIMSQELGLTITSNGGEGESTTSSGSDIQLITQKIYRRPTNYILGVDQTPVLSFPISLNAERKISAEFATQIEQKLFGKVGKYKKLQVIQSDMDSFYWNCFLTEPQIKRVGNEIIGWDCTVTCDSPWAYSFPKTITYNYTPPILNSSIIYNNRSGNNDYSFPTVIFTMSNAGGGFSIKNSTDNSRIFSFTGLAANETITVDNSLQIITSSTGLSRFDNFNKKFFRVLNGRNDLLISGNVTQVKFVAVDAQKIGG